ncbi:MAG: hypothetical protein NVSMB2_03950 [Chloroflexota bacterium]
MTDSTPAGGVDWFHPREVVVVAHIPRDRVDALEETNRTVHASLRAHGGPHVSDDPGTVRSFAFTAPDRQQALVFFFQKLAGTGSPGAVKATVEALHERLDAIGDASIEAISVMPHWRTRSHEGYSGGSPGSPARPVYADQVGGGRYAYRPVHQGLDFAQRVTGSAAVPVAILDTTVDVSSARRRATGFRDRGLNEHMLETLEWLERSRETSKAAPSVSTSSARGFGVSGMAGGVNPELEALDGEQGLAEPPAAQRIADHGLFIAGLIHAVAPTAPLTLDPVLNTGGLGDLSSLLVGLQTVLARKGPGDPCIVNLSLGFLPHPARLPAAWFGLRRPYDVDYVWSTALSENGRDERWAAAHRAHIDHCMNLLQVGLGELGTYLSLNNCLIVAAVGNDSQPFVDAGSPRMSPRLPARPGSVLGVAATAKDPSIPASYSNMGDEMQLGDHVATFGGVQANGPDTESAVIGIYSGEFSAGRPNETGWATWSGTSFATAIVSGIAANYWTVRASAGPLHASQILADLHADVSEVGPYVAALRTPAVEVRGEWQQV